MIGMDNYFTTPKVLEYLTEEGIAFVGTARNQLGFDTVADNRFNTVYTIPNQDDSYLICC